jgi:hypothetical protein
MGNPEMNDDDTMMHQVASECMEAIEKKDKEQFMQCMHVLMSDLLSKMQTQEGS